MTYGRLFLALALMTPCTLAGQSILGSSGLGLKVEPLDAAQRALGGVGVTARTPAVLPGNPVAALDVLAPSIAVTVQPHWGDFAVESAKGSFFATRFPVFGFVYPLGTDGVFTMTVGSQFDQNWSVESADSIDFGGARRGVTDTFVSEGALTAIQAGWARRWSRTFAAGATVGVYRGALTRTISRTFDGQTLDSLRVAAAILPYGAGGRWAQSGPLATLNLSWDPSPILQVGATVSWLGTVKLASAKGSRGVDGEVTAPLEYKASALTVLSPSLAINLGATYSDWNDLGGPSLDAVAAGGVLSYGGGVEWERLNFWAGALPLRFGFRRSELPFLFLGKKVKENTISAGFSIVVAQALDLPLAAIDFAIESGKRNSGTFHETFRRITLTTRVGGR